MLYSGIWWQIGKWADPANEPIVCDNSQSWLEPAVNKRLFRRKYPWWC